MSDEQRDPLDDLLAQARWPAATPGSTQRLTASWARLREPRRSTAWWAMAAAAAVLIVALATVTVLMRKERPAAPVLVVAPPAVKTQIALGREPTARELILLGAMERRQKQPASRPATSPVRQEVRQPPDEAMLARLIEQADGRADVEMAKRLCDVATGRSLPLVLKLSRDPNLRPVMTDAIARLADVRTLASEVQQDQRPMQRRTLISALLRRQSPEAFPLYLELINRAQTRSDALAALDGLRNPPIEQLMATLQSPRADLRIAAAWALGRINGPVVTSRLIRMIDAGQSRREAFIALAASRGSDAQAYLRQAAASDRFSSWARSAMAQTNLQ